MPNSSRNSCTYCKKYAHFYSYQNNNNFDNNGFKLTESQASPLCWIHPRFWVTVHTNECTIKYVQLQNSYCHQRTTDSQSSRSWSKPPMWISLIALVDTGLCHITSTNTTHCLTVLSSFQSQCKYMWDLNSDVIKTFFKTKIKTAESHLNFKTKTKTKTLKFFQDQDQDQDQA